MTPMNSHNVLHIPKIERGIVIDHIPEGLGITVLELFRSHPWMKNVVATVGLGYPSTKLGRKDMIKMDAEEIPPRVLEHISLVSPGISIKRIRNFEVDKKFIIQTPPELHGRVHCRNPICITNHERYLESHFKATRRDPEHYRCMFCERVYHLRELELKPE